MATNTLPVIPSCDGCGACCRHVGTPPGFFSGFARGVRLPDWMQDSDDWATWQAMPESVRDELRIYYRDLDADRVEDRAELGLSCLWYDEATARCRHYEHRPQVCREFEPGEPSCHDLRRRHGIGQANAPK